MFIHQASKIRSISCLLSCLVYIYVLIPVDHLKSRSRRRLHKLDLMIRLLPLLKDIGWDIFAIVQVLAGAKQGMVITVQYLLVCNRQTNEITHRAILLCICFQLILLMHPNRSLCAGVGTMHSAGSSIPLDARSLRHV